MSGTSDGQRRTSGPNNDFVGTSVNAQPGRRRIDVPMEDRHPAVVERVPQRNGRIDELEAVSREVDFTEERRPAAEREDRAAHVVNEAGQGQLR